jgi:hypothetical protein
MLRSILAACFVGCAVTASLAETVGPVTLDFTPIGARTASSNSLAPADTSFGHYPMSVFGIENAIKKYDGTASLDDGPIAYCVVAIRDWESRFPHDPSIPREMLHLQRDYEHANTSEGFEYARRLATWLQTDYPRTEFASLSRGELAKFVAPADPDRDTASHQEPSHQEPVSAAAVRPVTTTRPSPASTFDAWSRFKH